MARCSRCKQQSTTLHKFKGVRLCPKCSEEVQKFEDVAVERAAEARELPKPTRAHGLTSGQKYAMLQAGFLWKEIKEFNKASKQVITHPAFESMVESRRLWKQAMLLNGWTPEEIAIRLRAWYRKKRERSPWDFLDFESGARRKRKSFTRSEFSKYIQARGQIWPDLGKGYGIIRTLQGLEAGRVPAIPAKRQT